MGFLNNLGAVTILMLCGLLFAGIFGIFPMPYLLSARILKVETRNYWKAFGVSLISVVVLCVLGWLAGIGAAKLGLPGYAIAIVLLVLHIVLVTALILWIYHVKLIKALLIWLIALPFNLIIVAIAIFIWWFGLGMPVLGILKGLDYSVAPK